MKQNQFENVKEDFRFSSDLVLFSLLVLLFHNALGPISCLFSGGTNF